MVSVQHIHKHRDTHTVTCCKITNTYVTRSDEMGLKSHHAVPSISLKTVVGVNLGEIEIFALCRTSVIFTPYTCSFLIVFDP